MTVIEAGGNTPLQVEDRREATATAPCRSASTTQKEQRVTKPMLGAFQESTAPSRRRFVKEFRLPDGTTLEGEIDLSVTQFAVGDCG